MKHEWFEYDIIDDGTEAFGVGLERAKKERDIKIKRRKMLGIACDT
jgi:hypothetical protein